MIRYLIKNNVKLMFRNTWSVAVMMLGPLLVIAALSSAFSELMKSYEGAEEFVAGYRIEGELKQYVDNDVIKSAGEEAGIIFCEYPQGEIEDLMEKNEMAGFVEVKDDSYVVYQKEDHKVEGRSLEYFMDQLMSSIRDASLVVQTESNDSLPVEKLEFMPAIDSTDYYGIIYIAYFCWCGIVCATGVLSNEKKYGITRRFQVSNLSEVKNYLGKFIPVTITVMLGMGANMILTVICYDIHWGKPALSTLIIFVMIAASTAMALMFYYITNNLVITIIIQFTLVWIMGFFGGSFETYMFSSTPDSLKQLSPLYHGNRALVELSCMGESSYVASALIYFGVITVVCSAIAIVAETLRKRGRA